MAAPVCGSCTSPVLDAAICAGCTRELALALVTAASLAPDLEDAIGRLLRRGPGGGGPVSAGPPLPLDLAASDAATGLRVKLAVWANIAGCPPESPDTDRLALALLRRVGALRRHPQAADAHREIRDAVRRAVRAVDRLPERAPAGTCAQCGAQLLAELGADEVTCSCGMLASKLNDRRRERAAAADVLGTAAEISAVLASIGVHVPRGTITSWASRGRLGARGKSGMYALSDVLALSAERTAKAAR